MEAKLVQIYRYLIRNWNALLAGVAMPGVAVFSMVPPLQKYVPLFVFMAANSIVWTLIEIKSELKPTRVYGQLFGNMRLAKPFIVNEIEDCLKGTTQQHPLRLMLLGGRIRSMSDVIRELSDDLRSSRVRGHVQIELYCLDPGYIRTRVLPGSIAPDRQRDRNAAYASIIENVTTELRQLNSISYGDSTLRLQVKHYRADPFIYAYIVGDIALFWGTYSWAEVDCDFVGPENPCSMARTSDPTFHALRHWIVSRLRLFELEC